MWSSTIRQSLLDRFILEDGQICGDAGEVVEFDTWFISDRARAVEVDLSRHLAAV